LPRCFERGAQGAQQNLPPGGSTAIRIPREFNLESSGVMSKETAAGLLITPLDTPATVSVWWDSWETLPDFMEEGRNQPAVQERHFH
jgi:virulence-associated protein VagC